MLSSIFNTIQEYQTFIQYIHEIGPFQLYSKWWLELYEEAPQHVIVETALTIFIVWLLFIRTTIDPKKESDTKLSKKETDWLISTWSPKSLVPELSSNQKANVNQMVTITSIDGNYVKIKENSNNNSKLLNLSTMDFLGMSRLSELKNASVDSLNKYGCGACGPRGFYGTVDKHLDFETEIARFMGTPEAISYSDGASTVASTIPAFAKKGDLLIVDDAASEPIRTGAILSRARVEYFPHNDMKALREILSSIANDDKKYKRDATQQRRFIVTEGLSRHIGDICNLPELVELKNEFCYRLVLDESISFGTVGKTGKGLSEYYNIDINEIEIVTIAMDTTLASIGGVCIGSREVVDHQRLMGAGYCFSAAAPPFLSAAAIASLSELENNSKRVEHLQSLSEYFHISINKLNKYITPTSSKNSPVIHLIKSSAKDKENDWYEQDKYVKNLETEMKKSGYLVTATRHDDKDIQFFEANNIYSIQPSLRINLHSDLTFKDIDKTITALKAACKSIS